MPYIPMRVGMWDEPYMSGEPTTLQTFVADCLAVLPRKRDFYDRQIQAILGTKGKPLYDIQRRPNASPGLPTLRAIAEVLGQPFDLVLAAAEGRPATPAQVAAPDFPPSRSIHADDETVEVIQIDLSFSMGNGTHIDDYVEETPVRFDPSYIRAFTRSEISRLRLAKGVGDSMLPTLLSSDLVWIDTTQTRLNQADRIWACSILGAAAIKRLRRVGAGQVEVISDNPAVENRVYDEEDIIIHGRVIRFARDL
jgi:phage repressor protein C with HTH and peptisase S24 domain